MATQAMESNEVMQEGRDRGCGGMTFAPRVDIVEHDDKFVLRADVPGARAENIDINLERGKLTIHARIEPRQTREGARPLLREYGVGDFHRSFQIAEDIDPERISAEVTNGVLTLHVPKADVAKLRKIEVKSAN